MKGVLLSAGRGVRMLPLTRYRSKASLPLLNRPLFSHGLNLLKEWGCLGVGMNLFHLPETIERHLAEWRPSGLDVDLFHEKVLLGTAGPLKAMEEYLAGGTFWILNSDSLPRIDHAAMLDWHRSNGALVTMALKPYREGAGYAPVEIDPDGCIVRINGKPEGARPGSPHIFIGAQLAEPDLLDAVPPGRPCGTTGEVYPDLMRAGAPLMGWVSDPPWVEIGTPPAYLEANLDLLASLDTGDLLEPSRFRVISPGIFLENGLNSLPDRARGPLLLGKDPSLGGNVELGPGLVAGRGVTIGDGARVSRSILWDGSRIGPGADLEECIVAGGEIPAGIAFRRKILCPEGPEGLSVRDLRAGSPPAGTGPGKTGS